MLLLVTSQHKDKELQRYFDQNQDWPWEDLGILLACREKGLTKDQIKTMLHLVTNQHKDKELQIYFDENQEWLVKDPRCFEIIGKTLCTGIMEE